MSIPVPEASPIGCRADPFDLVFPPACRCARRPVRSVFAFPPHLCFLHPDYLLTFLSFFSLHQAKWLLMNSSGLPPQPAFVTLIHLLHLSFLTFSCYLHRKLSINPESSSSIICLSVSLTLPRQSASVKQGREVKTIGVKTIGKHLHSLSGFPHFPESPTEKRLQSSVCKLASADDRKLFF